MKLPFFKQPSEGQRAAMEQNSKAARADMLWKQGSRWLSRKKYSRAIEAMRQAYELEPSRLEGRLNLGAALYMAGQPDEAVQHFKYVLAFDPQNTMALLNLAACYDAAGNLEQSIATLETLVAERPQWKDAHYNLAIAYFKREMYDKAAEALYAELKLNPGHELARTLLNKIHLRLPRTSAGERRETGDGKL
ncbi:MAG TPA: tetratricopeptide repeat protein [Abditibacteriaceae bacterium]|jgi:tetratricopeptide (TPR) repeat protein